MDSCPQRKVGEGGKHAFAGVRDLNAGNVKICVREIIVKRKVVGAQPWY